MPRTIGFTRRERQPEAARHADVDRAGGQTLDAQPNSTSNQNSTFQMAVVSFETRQCPAWHLLFPGGQHRAILGNANWELAGGQLNSVTVDIRCNHRRSWVLSQP